MKENNGIVLLVFYIMVIYPYGLDLEADVLDFGEQWQVIAD